MFKIMGFSSRLKRSAGMSLIEMLLAVGMIALMVPGIFFVFNYIENQKNQKIIYNLSPLNSTDKVSANFYRMKKENELGLPVSENLRGGLLENVIVDVVVGPDYGLKMSKENIIARNYSYAQYSIKYYIPTDLLNNEQFKKGYRENLAKSLAIMNKDNVKDVDFKKFNENQRDFSNLLKELKLENKEIKDVTPQDIDYSVVFNL